MKIKIELDDHDIKDILEMEDIKTDEVGFDFPHGIEVRFPDGSIYSSFGVQYPKYFEYDAAARCAVNYPVHKAMVSALRRLSQVPHGPTVGPTDHKAVVTIQFTCEAGEDPAAAADAVVRDLIGDGYIATLDNVIDD